MKIVVHTFNPDCIVIGGGVSLADDDFFSPELQKTKKMLWSHTGKHSEGRLVNMRRL